MELLVIRHALAVERAEGASAADDAARPLTSRGRRRFRDVVRGLQRLGFATDRVLHSPWQRAVETADLLEPLVDDDLDDVRVATPHLAAPPRAELFALIAERGARVALVGHEPWLGQLVALLTVGAAEQGDTMPFRKGGVAWLEGSATPGGMQLRALLPPRVLRRIR
ncbi:MAG: histidine phosphatase family protein [Kofleriaceae bacterium]|nr:histidine phosphatase family protein [Kofleriaceae bacterium]MCB9571189.1 histidine phosphatase family protein [Kofleriaceae bacterium]